MQQVSKLIRFYLLSIISIALTFSCNEDDPYPIPNIQFVLEPINIYDPEYAELLNPYGTYVVKETGYLENGIMIVNLGNNDYKAYDCTCTFEVKDSCWVRPNPKLIDNSSCSCCGSAYDLTFGNPLSGNANYALKAYKVVFDNNTIQVYN